MLFILCIRRSNMSRHRAGSVGNVSSPVTTPTSSYFAVRPVTISSDKLTVNEGSLEHDIDYYDPEVLDELEDEVIRALVRVNRNIHIDHINRSDYACRFILSPDSVNYHRQLTAEVSNMSGFSITLEVQDVHPGGNQPLTTLVSMTTLVIERQAAAHEGKSEGGVG